jgi:hypothetical protein
MKKFNAAEWCMIILTVTIPVTLAGLMIARAVTGAAVSAESAALLGDFLKVVSGGILGLIAGKRA